MKSLHVLGAKTDPDVALRVYSFLGTITRDYRAKNVLVVSHSVVVLIFPERSSRLRHETNVEW